MALVISFVPDPAKAVAEMARVRARRMGRDLYVGFLDRRRADRSDLSRDENHRHRPAATDESRRLGTHGVRSLWTTPDYNRSKCDRITIDTVFSGFDDYWAANAQPSGPQGIAITRMAPEVRERFRAALRDQLPEVPMAASHPGSRECREGRRAGR